MLWVNGQEECAHTAQPTVDVAQASAMTEPWVGFPSPQMDCDMDSCMQGVSWEVLDGRRLRLRGKLTAMHLQQRPQLIPQGALELRWPFKVVLN